jgi:signal transduction histidine kinase
MYRITQEALHNVVKHARGTRVALRLACGDERIVLDIEDDGQGFDPTASYPGHLGLRSMRERATRLGGTLTITSAPGSGTAIHVEIPIHPPGLKRKT